MPNVMIRREEDGRLSLYVPKKDLEEMIESEDDIEQQSEAESEIDDLNFELDQDENIALRSASGNIPSLGTNIINVALNPSQYLYIIIYFQFHLLFFL